MEVTSFNLQKIFSIGDKIIIRYRATNRPQFAINLRDNKENNIILHINPRYETTDPNNNRKLVLNTCVNDKWQVEVKENFKGNGDLRGDDKKMTIFAKSQAEFEITADGETYKFPMRISVDTCTGIEITNAGSFKSVVHEKLTYNPASTYDFDWKK